jgi:hypothetical protein
MRVCCWDGLLAQSPYFSIFFRFFAPLYYQNMNKILSTAWLSAVAFAATAQNVQFHYDFGRRIYSDEEATRQNVTVTLEQFKADAWGSWFWFIDLDMYSDGMKGAYTEISREFTVASADHGGWAAHVEYDGGLATFHDGGGTRFQNAALIGPAWNGHNADFSATWSVQALYKQYFRGQDASAYASFQLTGVWGLNFAHNRYSCSGYVDLWRGRQNNGHGTLIVMAEPQFWYNFNRRFSVGTEVEVSNHFVIPEVTTDRTCYVNPTLAVKYNF